jgi:23S rRNA (cytidine1920-2'-O)/16S rRNA (cytidine1409-2'-O)-methyltransferase
VTRPEAKERLDVLLASRGLAESREIAQRLIGAGQVLVDGQPALKAGHRFPVGAALEVKSGPPFVSRGGEKLDAAFAAFGLRVEGLVCLDVGASTGGFTDCMLQRGAARVYAVDTGKGQFHWKLRNDPRVTLLENTNARYLKPDAFADRPAFVAIDVSFISLTKVLPAVIQTLAERAQIVTLVKPQFEAGRAQVGKGGVVRDPAVHQAVLDRIREFGTQALGLAWMGCRESPLRGPAGNIEFLVWWVKAK